MVNLKKIMITAAIGLFVASSFTAQAANKIRWKVPTAFGTSLPALGDQIVEIAESLKRMSGGDIQLKIFEPKALVPSSGITQAVKDNKLPVGYTWLGYDKGRIPASVLISSSRPFSYSPDEFVAWWYEGGGRELGHELYATHNIRPILCGLSGPETGGWFRKEINSIDDFKGLKIRFSGLGGNVLQKVGASVTMLPGGELFPALEKGALDATEYATPAADVKLGFYKVAKYNYFPGWHQQYTSFHLIVNTSVWNKMSEPQKAIVETGCQAGVLKNLARSEALSGPQIKKNKSLGVIVKTYPMKVQNKLKDITKQVVKELAAKDGMFRKVYESQQAFDNDYQHWVKIGYVAR